MGTHLELIDLSHTVEDGLVTYAGLPAPIIGDFLSRDDSKQFYDPGVEFHIGKIEMVANTGTYVDAPFHRYLQGSDLSQLPLSSLAALDGLVVRAARGDKRAITRAAFEDYQLAERAILIHTGWSANWNTESYFEGHPFLTEDAAEFLRDSGVALVGIDSYNIDDTSDGRRPAHSILLAADIPIVEHLTNLDSLPDENFTFFAVPVKVKGLGSFPVRAFAALIAS